MAPRTKKETFRKIKLDLIDRPEESVRMEIDQEEIENLARSIKERGLLQPIGVAPRGERFKLCFGDRRYLAHSFLDLTYILCKIMDIDDDQIVIDRAMENVQRVDLTPFEEGHIYIGLEQKAGMSVEEISKRVGKSPGLVQRRMDIMRMPDSFQKALHNKQISISVAEELWSCPDGAKREYFLELAIEHGITAMIARNWVQDFRKNMRKREEDVEGGGSPPMEYEDVPIYRACDLCKGPVDYKDLRELRICTSCHTLITDASQSK